MCLDSGEEVAPTTCNYSASMEEMDRALCIYVNMKNMRMEFDRSMAMGLGTMQAPLKQNPKC